jgi:hypothetical protein
MKRASEPKLQTPAGVIDAPSAWISLEKLCPHRASLRFTRRVQTKPNNRALQLPLNTGAMPEKIPGVWGLAPKEPAMHPTARKEFKNVF